MSRRKVIDLPLLELYSRTGVRPIVTDLSATKDRVSALENAIPTKVSLTMLADDWVEDAYSFEDTYPSAIMAVEIVTSSDDGLVVGDQYVIHASILNVDCMYKVFDESGVFMNKWIEITNESIEDEVTTYSFDSYDDEEKTNNIGSGTFEITSTTTGYNLDIYLDEDNATRAERDAYVDAVFSSNSEENVIVALDGAPVIDIPIILEVVRTDGGESS